MGRLRRCDGVGPLQREGPVDRGGDPDLRIRAAADGLVEPDALHEGDVLDQTQQGGLRGDEPKARLLLGQTVQAVVQRGPVAVDQLVQPLPHLGRPPTRSRVIGWH